MAPRAPPTSQFELWACARLRSLYEARCDDTRRGTSRKNSKFGTLLRIYMSQYGDQPFSRSSWEGHAGQMKQCSDAALRKASQAEQYLRNHSFAPSGKLAAFEAAGGIAADHPHKAAPAIELWGSGGAEGARINELVCAELGIPANTAAAVRPDGWIGARKTILTREFALLPETEQKEWQELAHDRRVAVAAEAALPVDIQDRQQEFRAELSALVNKKIANRGLGHTFVLQFQGFFIGEEDRVVHQFRGRASSYEAPNFYNSTEYTEKVTPLWAGYIRKQAQGFTVPRLQKLTEGLSVEELDKCRIQLKSWFELMFDFDMPEPVDNDTFWAEVKERPSDFIADHRIPEGTRFDDPTRLTEDEFKVLYHHVYNTQNKRGQLDESERVLFEQSAIEDERAAQCAARLKKMQATRRTSACDPNIDVASTAQKLEQNSVEAQVADVPFSPAISSLSAATVPSTLTSAPTATAATTGPAGNSTKKRKRPSSEEAAAMSQTGGSGVHNPKRRTRRESRGHSAPGHEDSSPTA